MTDENIWSRSLDSNNIKCLHAKKVKKLKDNILTTGRWTDEGLERYNNLLVNIREAWQHRGNFEIELTGQHVLNEPRDVYLNKQHKRK